MWTRNFTIFTVNATTFWQFTAAFHNYIGKIDHFTLDLLKRSDIKPWTIRKEATKNENSNVRIHAESWTYWKSPLKQDKHPYKWSTIGYNSINTGTSKNIFWSNSSLQMWSASKAWKTAYVIKTGPTEKFL